MANIEPSSLLLQSRPPTFRYSPWMVRAILIFIFGLVLITGCSNTDTRETAVDLRYANKEVAKANASYAEAKPPNYSQFSSLAIPPLPPQKALQTFELEQGFDIEIVAHEPDVVDPVAMDIDADGRLWVAEMRTYMPVYDKDAA